MKAKSPLLLTTLQNSSDSQGTTCSLQMRKSLIWCLLLRSFHWETCNHFLANNSSSTRPKKRSCVSMRQEIHSSEDNVLLWGVRCHSLPRVGHTFLSLLWWISLPRPHLSELKGCLWVSSSQHHKVPFVSAVFGIHPHMSTWGHLVSEDGTALRKDQRRG